MTKNDDDARDVLTMVDQISVDGDGVELASLVVDGGGTVTVPLTLLPPGARVGDILAVRLERDEVETAARRKRVVELQRRLFGSEPGR